MYTVTDEEWAVGTDADSIGTGVTTGTATDTATESGVIGAVTGVTRDAVTDEERDVVTDADSVGAESGSAEWPETFLASLDGDSHGVTSNATHDTGSQESVLGEVLVESLGADTEERLAAGAAPDSESSVNANPPFQAILTHSLRKTG